MKTATSPFARRRTTIALGWVLLALISGCAALVPGPAQTPVLHLLEANPPAVAARERSDRVLEVAAPRAWPGFDTPRMAYTLKPYELDYFATSQWADTPARMIAPLLARALEQTGAFQAVVRAPGAVAADVRVHTEVVRLVHSFTTRPSRVELVLRIDLVDARAKQVFATRVVEEIEPAPSENAYGGVRAANAALERALVRIAELVLVDTGRP